MNSDNERRLVDSASRGDTSAIAQLIAQHLPRLRAFIRLRASPLIRAKESCSDLVQSVCREVFEHLDRYQYRGEANFRQWLYSTALRKIVDRQRYWLAEKRDAARETSPAQNGDGDSALAECYRAAVSPSQVAMGREDLKRLETVFDMLPDDYREVITLSRVVGLSHAEIAETLGRSEGAVRVLLSRALARLGTLLREVFPTDESG